MAVIHNGTQTIETQRLILRRFCENDVEDAFENWSNDPEVTRHLTWKPNKNAEETREIVTQWIENYKKPDYYLWAITLKDDGKAIGSIEIRNSEHDRCGEIGYCLSRRFWSKGIMTEALKAVIDFGFSVGYERIQATHHTENPASGRVMQKAGMVHEGTLRKFGLRNDGTLADCEMYAIIKD